MTRGLRRLMKLLAVANPSSGATPSEMRTARRLASGLAAAGFMPAVEIRVGDAVAASVGMRAA